MLHVAVQTGRFDVGAEMAALPAGETLGGIGCFVGRVRGEGGLVALTLEHYPGMTERVMAAVAEEACARFGLCACRVVHRVGRLVAGEDIVLVLTAGRHRAEALDGARYLIDWLKTDAPFWKLEEFAAGERRWVAARAADAAARARWDAAPG